MKKSLGLMYANFMLDNNTSEAFIDDATVR